PGGAGRQRSTRRGCRNIIATRGPMVRTVSTAAALAATAGSRPLAKVLAQGPAAAAARQDVTAHLRAHAAEQEIHGTPEDGAFRAGAVPAGPAGLLVVAFQRAGGAPVDHPTHVWLVDPHAERRGRHDHRH